MSAGPPEAAPRPGNDAPGGEQYNRQNGDAAVALFLGGRPAKIVPLDFAGGTPNQKGEKLANQVAFCAKFDGASLPDAVHQATAFLRFQMGDEGLGITPTGHMCVAGADEVLTASHAPIWERLILSLYLSAWRLHQRGGDYGTFWAVARRFMLQHYSLYGLLQVPAEARGEAPGARGLEPIGGWVVAPGARNAKGAADQVRSVCAQLALLGRAVSPVGARWWDQVDQSTLGALMARRVTEPGGPGWPDLSVPELPRLRVGLRVTRSAVGHAGQFVGGLGPPQALDPAASAWVRYATGEIGQSADWQAVPADILAGGEVTEVAAA